MPAANAPSASLLPNFIPFIRSTQHARPAHETRRSDEQTKRRDKRDETVEEGSPLIPSRMASAMLSVDAKTGETKIQVVSQDSRKVEEISPAAFARRAIAGGAANRPGLVLDMFT